MREIDDELLVAYLDGELDEASYAAIDAALASDAVLRSRLDVLADTTALVRRAFDDVLHEPIPARLLAAASGEQVRSLQPSSVLDRFRRVSGKIVPAHIGANMNRHPWASMAVAASLLGLMIGTPIGYIAGGGAPQTGTGSPQVASAAPGWLDNLVGYHNLFISSADGAENTVFDVPAGSEKRLPVDIRVPDLKPYSLTFRGARRIVLDGKPAFQFFYGSPTKKSGAITLFITSTSRPELTPTFERRDNVNLIYWRHLGHGYAIAGQADKGTMSSLANDVAWQLRAQ